MKYIWQEEDVKCGRYICRESYPEDCEDVSGLCSVTYKLGFISGSSSCMCLISISDGMVVQFSETEKRERDAKHVFIGELNNDEHGYRPLTQKQILRRMDYLQNMNEGKR